MQKWARLEGNVGVVKKSRTLHVLLSFGPSNLIHVPTPMKHARILQYRMVRGCPLQLLDSQFGLTGLERNH